MLTEWLLAAVIKILSFELLINIKKYESWKYCCYSFIDIQIIKDLKDALKENNFSVSLNLIQTYKSLSISEGFRLEPNNPVFLLKGKSYLKITY